jgi:hypothetical protein
VVSFTYSFKKNYEKCEVLTAVLFNPALLDACSRLLSCLTYSSTQKMEATNSSEVLSGFQRTASCCIPEKRTCEVGFEVLSVVVIRNYIFWNITQICLLPSSWWFLG